MIHLILLLIYILLILGVIFVEQKSPTEAMLWVLVLVCLPYVGAVLYLVFGSTINIKITAWVRRSRLQSRLHRTAHSEEPLPKENALSETDQQVIQFNHTYNNSRLTSYAQASVYTCGEDHYRALFADLKAAKECIFIEFYTIHHDVMGQALVKTLTEKAKQGVTVLVLCDFVANLRTPRKMFQPLIQAGGQVIRVKPYFTHYRSHRKIVAIDHKISYIGGMNIGKQYANLAEKKNPWRDTQVRLVGACTAELEEYFLNDWICAVKKPDWENTVHYVESLSYPPQPAGQGMCQFVTGGVDTSKEGAKMCYLSMIRSARKSIRIQTPYFIPDASILDELKTAAASGVQIELMVPGIRSSFFLEPVTTHYAGQLLEYGAKVYRYNGYVHAKTMIIDDELCCIGSVNMDMRSLLVDDEVCGVFYSNEFVRQYSEIYTEDIQHCVPYTWQEFHSRSMADRAKERVFLPFAPLM